MARLAPAAADVPNISAIVRAANIFVNGDPVPIPPLADSHAKVLHAEVPPPSKRRVRRSDADRDDDLVKDALQIWHDYDSESRRIDNWETAQWKDLAERSKLSKQAVGRAMQRLFPDHEYPSRSGKKVYAVHVESRRLLATMIAWFDPCIGQERNNVSGLLDDPQFATLPADPMPNNEPVKRSLPTEGLRGWMQGKKAGP